MQLTSSAFRGDQPIPRRFSGEGADHSPPLQWMDPPKDTQSFALLCEDADAPGRDHPFLHWMIFDIPASIRNLPEGVPSLDLLPGALSAAQGPNSFGKIGYNGPLPPTGDGVHHYHFTLYALDREIDDLNPVSKNNLLAEMKGHVLATATLVGTYERRIGRDEVGHAPREGARERSLGDDVLVLSSDSDDEEKRRERSIFSN